MPSHEQLIDGTLMAQVVILICYSISSLVVIGNNYAGFNGFFTALLFGGGIYFTHHGLKNISRTLYGIILGGVSILVFISLESAIFWGQYSGCTHYSTIDDSSPPTMKPTKAPTGDDDDDKRRLMESVDFSFHTTSSSASMLSGYEGHYSRQLSGSIGSECRNQSAMKSMCTFSVFMFLSYLVLGAFLVHYKNAILGSAPLNEGYDEVGGASSSGKTGSTTKFPTSADF